MIRSVHSQPQDLAGDDAVFPVGSSTPLPRKRSRPCHASSSPANSLVWPEHNTPVSAISPHDSAYGSKDGTPVTPQRPPRCLTQQRRTYDDAQSRYAPVIPHAFHTDELRNPLATRSTNTKRLKGADTLPDSRYPDRFIPRRDNNSPVAEKLRTSVNPRRLSKSEKLVRHRKVGANPFRVTPGPATTGALSLRWFQGRSGLSRRHISGGAMRPVVERQPSHGTVWSVGGPVTHPEIENDRSWFLHHGQPRIASNSGLSTAANDQEDHNNRLARALDIDQARRILETDLPDSVLTHLTDIHRRNAIHGGETAWNGSEWECAERPKDDYPVQEPIRILPSQPFKTLDAQNLRDDFYCSVLAYSHTCGLLAMGLGHSLYGWSEETGAILLMRCTYWIRTVDFSSTEGGKSILAFGLADGRLGLMTPSEIGSPRFAIDHPYPVAFVSWRPVCTTRPSKNPFNPGITVETEDLLVGDHEGDIFYYVVEWPKRWEVERDNWPGTLTLVARIKAHAQQICGLAWSPKGDLFASGANDNHCCLFSVNQIFGPPRQDARGVPDPVEGYGSHNPHFESLHQGRFAGAFATDPNQELTERRELLTTPQVRNMLPGSEKFRWPHGAAVKAIAFCPWLDGLLATGGGSHDKAIHFFHTATGASLATIAVSAQVTSLVWSTSRRELAATFGYPQPDHPYRIAVFSWPDCRQVAAIPWSGGYRAIYALAYPRLPRDDDSSDGARSSFSSGSSGDGIGSGSGSASGNGGSDGSGASRRRGSRASEQEGCLVVAASDESVRFYEVWSVERTPTVGGSGMFAGSDILEGLEGVEKDGEVIR